MCVCLPYVPFLFPSRYTTSSIRLQTYVHGRTIKRASTATSGHHSAHQNELFLWKRVSTSLCRNSLNGTSVDVRMWTYRGSSVPRRKEKEDFLFPSRSTTTSIRPHTYVHGRNIKRASTATSGHHSAQPNELFLWKSVSASRL